MTPLLSPMPQKEMQSYTKKTVIRITTHNAMKYCYMGKEKKNDESYLGNELFI